jgi:hypothetical protein
MATENDLDLELDDIEMDLDDITDFQDYLSGRPRRRLGKVWTGRRSALLQLEVR